MANCTSCGAALENGAKFCPSCGKTVEAPAPQPVYAAPAAAPAGDLTKPVSVGGWMLVMLLMMIPIVNIIMMFVWGFGSSTNVNKMNYARAHLIWALIGIVLGIVFGTFVATILNGILSSMT